MMGVAARSEHLLVTREYLRDAAQCGGQRQHHLHAVRIAPQHVADTVGVMVRTEDKDVLRIGIERIVGNRVKHLGDTLVPILIISVKSLAESAMQGKIHDRREVGVESVAVHRPVLPIGQLGDVVCPDLAHYVDVRILLAHRGTPLGHRHLLIVRISVHAQAVKVGIFDPPNSPLLEILQQIRVVEVHVRHRGIEPSALHVVPVDAGRIGIVLHREIAVGVRILRPLMDPVRERKVLHPPMRITAVVGHDVHDHLDAALMAFAHELAVHLIVSEAGIDAVIVTAGISVVGLARLIVLEQRSVPDGRCAQVGDIVQMVHNALYVASVTASKLLAVSLVVSIRRIVIGRIAVGEAVRHDQVDQVGGGETLAFGRAFAALPYLIRHLECVLSVLHEHDPDLARSPDLDVDEQVVRTLSLVDARHFGVAEDADVIVRDGRTLDKQLEVGLHPCPPARGFHAGYLLRSRLRNLRDLLFLSARAQRENADGCHEISFHIGFICNRWNMTRARRGPPSR